MKYEGTIYIIYIIYGCVGKSAYFFLKTVRKIASKTLPRKNLPSHASIVVLSFCLSPYGIGK